MSVDTAPMIDSSPAGRLFGLCLAPHHPYLDGSALPDQHLSSPAVPKRSTAVLLGTPSGKASSCQSMGGGVLENGPRSEMTSSESAGYAKAAYMARYLLGIDERNTTFHSRVSAEGVIVTFSVNYPGRPEEAEAHQAFVEASGLPELPQEFDPSEDGYVEDVCCVPGVGTISRQIIQLSSMGSRVAFVNYLACRDEKPVGLMVPDLEAAAHAA